MADESLAGSALLRDAFAGARAEGRAALMPYMMGGFPDQATSRRIAAAYVAAGADVVELGVPFSDPLADGPVIHAAATEALAAGATYDSVLAIGAEFAHAVPVVLMVYANMVLQRDPDTFAADLEANGIAGVIVPDLPPEEGAEVRAALAGRGLAFVPLVAPNTAPARRALICGSADGFVYLVSDTRTTGERDELPAALGDLIAATKADSPVPVAVGFGIGTPEQAAAVGGLADGVIVGSRLVRAAAEEDPLAAVSAFIGAARDAMSIGSVG